LDIFLEARTAIVSQVRVISDAEFESDVLQAKGTPVLAYFWASWCGPCRLMGPSVDWAASAWGDRLAIVKLEVDPNPNSVKHCQVEGVPALRLFQDGQEIAASEGALTKAKLEAFLTPYLGTPASAA
jgi:thioredoxin 1